MSKLKLILIAIASLSLFAACGKTETASATTPASSVAEATPAPAETTPTAEPSATTEEPMATETVASTESAPAPAAAPSTPAPLLPRRGESTTPVTPPAAQSTEDRHAAAQASQRIKIEDAFEIVRAGNGILLDVRTADAHQYQRIPGSLNIPLPEVANRAKELPQDKWIITYCTCPAEESSGAAASTLTNMGFERAAALLGGMQGWRGAGLPVEFGQQ